MRLFFYCVFVSWSLSAWGQDLHFSQFNRNPFLLNPAMAGAFDGDWRAAGMVRSQWGSVPVPYLTTTLLTDAKLKDFGNGILGGGLSIDYDRAGDADLSHLRVGLTAAYTRQLSDQWFLSGGLQGTMVQRAFEADQLTFAEQYNGDIFDPTLPGESFVQQQATALTVAGGLNLHFQLPDRRTKVDLGAGAFNLNQPVYQFTAVDAPATGARYSGYALAAVQVAERLDLVAQVLYSTQTSYREGLGGGGIRYHLNTTPDQETSLQLTGSYRLGDAVIPALELRYRMWLAGVSYDINTSSLNRATSGRGGPEFFVQYILTRVKPPTGLKVCPIF